MELKATATGQWVAGTLPGEISSPGVRAILLFGPDQGGVFEFARLAAIAGGDYECRPSDHPVEDVISSLGSGSLFGGATSVRLDGVDDRQAGKIERILEAPFSDDARLILAAGDLKPSSKLRKLFASRKDCVSAPLYLMRDRDLSRFASTFFEHEGLSLDREAGAKIVGHLSGDRALAARACEVVSLHARGRGSSRVESADVSAVLDAVDEEGLSAPLDHALLGEIAEGSLGVTRRLASGESFVGMLRVFSMRLFRLRAMLETGLSPRDAVAKAKPPVFWTERDRTTRILGGLSIWKIDRMLDLVDRSEHRIIEAGVSPEAAMPSLIMDISRHRGWKEAA